MAQLIYNTSVIPVYLVRYGHRSLRHPEFLTLSIYDSNPIISVRAREGKRANKIKRRGKDECTVEYIGW